MKRFLSLSITVLAFAFLFEQPCFAEENTTNTVNSTEEELNDAQIFEKKLLENRKMKKTKKVTSSVHHQTGAKKTGNIKTSGGSSGKGLPHSSMPSLSNNMFVK